MTTTVLDRSSAARLGINLRHVQQGPEQELVKWFIESMPLEIPSYCRRTIFLEPRIQSGFPDIVVVHWNPKTTLMWKDDRQNLNETDVRVLHHLVTAGTKSASQIQDELQLNPVLHLEKLISADTVRRCGKRFESKPLSKIYAVDSIIAIEAKTRGWDVVLTQATLNTWFASHSYILVPDSPRVKDFIQIADNCGVGVWTRSNGRLSSPPAYKSNVPLSYASWLFNEWAWRLDRFAMESSPCR